MGLSAAVGSFAQPSSTGNQAITGLGFQPVLVLFWMTHLTADGFSASTRYAIGAAASSTARWYVANSIQDNAATPSVSCLQSASKCIGALNFFGAKHSEADFVSMDSGGFTVNWTTVDSTARIVSYLALGGSDLTNVAVGSFTDKTSTGTKAITGVGFQPDCVILGHGMKHTSLDALQSPSAQQGGIGLALSTSNRATSGFSLQNTGNDCAYQRTSEILGKATTATADTEADLSSMDSDGFTLNYTAVTGSANYEFYVALKGVQFALGTISQPSSNGNQATTGLAFQPVALLMSSMQYAANTSPVVGSQFNVGAGVSSSARFNVFVAETDAANPVRDGSYLDRAGILRLSSPTGGTGAGFPTADLVSLDAAGWTLNWSNTDATARQIVYLAIGAAAVTARGQQPTVVRPRFPHHLTNF